MTRGANQIGWPSTTASKITPGALNLAIPRLSLFLPASLWTEALLQPAIFIPNFSTDDGAALNDTVDVWEFITGQNREIYCKFDFMGWPIDVSDPQFKFFPEYIQIADTLAPDPAEFAFMEYSIGNNVDGVTSDYSLEGAETQLQSEIPAKRISFSSGSTFDEAINFASLDGPSALSTTKKNNLRLQLERFGGSASDTYGESIYFLGMGVQYKTDFNNVAVYPTA